MVMSYVYFRGSADITTTLETELINNLLLMKKLALLLLFKLAIGAGLCAQVSIGVKVGGALTNNVYDGIGLGESDFIKPSFLSGFWYQYPFPRVSASSPNYCMSIKGFRP